MNTANGSNIALYPCCARALCNKILRKLALSKFCFPPSYNKAPHSLAEAGALIQNLLQAEAPAMICRLGAVENAIVASALTMQAGLARRFSDKLLFEMHNNAGIFPATPHIAIQFSKQVLEDMAEVDCLAVWGNSFEDYIANTYAADAELIALKAISPCELSPPWSSALAGKRVLVIHPFAPSIEKQYARRHLLFEDQDTLPEFTLRTIKAVQSCAGEKPPLFNT